MSTLTLSDQSKAIHPLMVERRDSHRFGGARHHELPFHARTVLERTARAFQPKLRDHIGAHEGVEHLRNGAADQPFSAGN
jgi:hypothetical protein